MDAGYTAVERAIEGILNILGEESPAGRDFHKVLLDRVTRPLTGDHARPAIFDEDLKQELLEAFGRAAPLAKRRQQTIQNYGSSSVSQ